MELPRTSFAPLDLPSAEVETLSRLLSPDERERAARFVFERDRRRYVAARGTLRRLLGAELGVDAAAIEFRYGPNGKPFIEGPLHFNLSHSEEWAFFALSKDGPVGCDIESVRPLPDLVSIVSRWFAPAECELILDSSDREALFFRYWTLKEAVLKGIGSGLTLLSCDFALHQRGEHFRAHGAGELPLWTAVPQLAPSGFMAAVAVRQPGSFAVQPGTV
jgi:4'-phosphopantetheinyl transferase